MKRQSTTVTFKIDPATAELLDRVPNKSEFIRQAILKAVDNTCPLCQGTGLLSPDAKRHWEKFAEDHKLQKCRDCHSVYLKCDHNGESHEHHGD